MVESKHVSEKKLPVISAGQWTRITLHIVA